MGGFDGVIFDMDGTLIEGRIDFAGLRRRLGIAPGEGILEALDALPEPLAGPRRGLLLEEELAAARTADLQPGAADLLDRIRAAGLKTALLTRSGAEAMRTVLGRFALHFDLAWSRENGPIKPEPDGILRACRTLRIDPARTACVGDFRFDILAANAAGAVSVLYDPAGTADFAHLADHTIARLADLCDILGV